jgi:probable O-glycosylation ligase (exosortase A-associated)
MLRSLDLTFLFLAFLVVGSSAPFVLCLGYVWVDGFNPQLIATAILNHLPDSLIMALAAIGGYFVLDRRSPRLDPIMVLALIMATYVTMSTALWSVAPGYAWPKWNFAFKTIMFSAFIPLVFRSRIQIEAFMQIWIFSLVGQFLPVGIKTLIHGGGYGIALGLVDSNSGLAEGSTLAGVSIMIVPIILFLRANTRIVPRSFITDLVYSGLIVGAVAAAVGTYERTGLIAMIVAGTGLWLRARRKVLFGIIAGMAAAAVILLTSQAWNARISTIDDYNQETSALGRILVWKWTLGFVSTHPFGGGFNAFQVDRIEFPGTPSHPEPVVIFGKAFHSIYFEVLGEQGYLGLALFLGTAVVAFLALQGVARQTKHMEGMGWCREMAYALQISLLTLLASGAFIGIAFQPMFWYLFALSACLRQHVKQARLELARPARNWTPVRARVPVPTA